MFRLILTYGFILFSCLAIGQEEEELTALTVEDAIVAIESEYSVRFSYSKQVVPYQEMVELDMTEPSLPKLLKSLEVQTGIVYRQKGKRVALSYDPQIKKDFGLLAIETGKENEPNEPNKNLPPEGRGIDEKEVINPSSGDVYATNPSEPVIEYEISKSLFEPRVYDRVAVLEELTSKDPRVSSIRDSEEKSADISVATAIPVKEEVHLAQFSLVSIRSLSEKKERRKYRLSVNAISGVSGSVEGLEVGGIKNTVKKNVDGVQFSGLFNKVEGNVTGGQMAGWSNRTKGIMRGLQMAGFSNRNQQADAVQFAGIFNYNRDVSRGFQWAGLFNISRNIAGGQIAGLFNFSSGNNDAQLAGLVNIADQTKAQVGGFLNVAREVGWLQVGLINVADTVSGASFGLLNLIRRGYNKIEISINEALFGNFAVKLGTKKFYNIFQISSNFKRNRTGNGLIWGYGYGFGFFQKITPQVKLNPEVLVMNIHERNLLQADLNLLNQFKLLFHFNTNTKAEFFIGPTFNLSISKVKSFDSGIVGTDIAPYTIWDTTYFRSFNSINTKFWIGFSAGVRI